MASRKSESDSDHGDGSQFRKRLSSHNLRINIERANSLGSERDLLSNHSDLHDHDNTFELPETSDSDVVEEGRDLFENFVKEEIQKEGLFPPIEYFTSPSVRTPQGYRNPMWAKAGKELREMADAFAQTKERERVRRRANTLSLEEPSAGVITYAQFRDFLQEMLSGGITRERIIVLFFFCSDLAIRTLRLMGLDLYRQLLQYSVRFITDTVCHWVEQQGGWNAVLSTSLQVFQYILGGIATILVISGVVWWIKKKNA